MAHLFTAANILTAFRLLLFGIFTIQVMEGRLTAAIIWFVLAWGLDVVDGWLARAHGQATAFGSLLDKAVDRIVIVGGLFVLISEAVLPLFSVLIVTKDILLVAILPVHLEQRRGDRGLGPLGKVTSFLQGIAIIWLLLGGPWPLVIISVVAVLGAIVAVSHLWNMRNPREGVEKSAQGRPKL